MADTTKKKELLDDIDDGDLILENVRESIPLTPENATFTRSAGNLISLTLHHEDGEDEFFERIVLMRAFPMTSPEEYLVVRESDTPRNRGKEIGMIRRMSDFDEQTCLLFLEELDRRYFTSQILKIHSIKDKFGYLYWDCDTSAGHLVFTLTNPFSTVRQLEDGRVFLTDIDGNSFFIPNPKELDRASYRRLEIYM